MLKIDNVKVIGFEDAVRGMRNPMNSWEKSDSKYVQDGKFEIGADDYRLMKGLASAGPVDGKYRRMIVVYMDILGPLYWWKEFDTYKVGTVANSCSTMHTIHKKEFTLEDFSNEHLFDVNVGDDWLTNQEAGLGELPHMPKQLLGVTIDTLNFYRKLYLQTKDKKYWWQMIQLLPSSYNQKRTVMLNYEVLANIHKHRWNHKLDEWHTFCAEIRKLPYAGLITCDTKGWEM